MKRFLLSLVALVITSVCFAQNDNNNRDIVTKETATQFSNDQALLDMYNNRNKKRVTPEMKYKRGKRMKTVGYIVGSTLVAGGIVAMIAGSSHSGYKEELYVNYNSIDHYKWYDDDGDLFVYIGAGAIAAGVAVGVPLIVKGSSLQKKHGPQVYSMSAISHDINFSNGASLNLGVDVLSNNLSYIKTPGFGVRYNF